MSELMGEVMDHFANVVLETAYHLQQWAKPQGSATQHKQIALNDDPCGDFVEK